MLRLACLPAFLAAALTFTSCAPRTPLACPTASPQRAARVFFATDRQQAEPTAKAKGSLHFTGERTSPPALQMGWQQVRLGPKHHLGVLDKDVVIAPAQIETDTRRRGNTLYSSDDEIRAYVNTAMRGAIRATQPAPGGRRQVLLFVHGYNSSFDYSVQKAAQLAADLQMITCDGKARGVPVAYSWPSRASLFGYLADEESAEWTQQRLVPFIQALSAVARQEGADFHIVAHSMGTRAVVRSLAQIALMNPTNGGRDIAEQVILLAPDMARILFDQYFQRFLPLVEHLTIYVSSKDRALGLSSLLHGGSQRLGLLESTVRAALKIATLGTFGDGPDNRDLGEAATAAAASGKIDMIDVSSGVADVIGHSYEDEEFIGDVAELIYHRTPAGTGKRSNLEQQNVRPDLFGLFGKRLRYFRLKIE